MNELAIRQDLLGRIEDPNCDKTKKVLAECQHKRLAIGNITYQELHDLGYGSPTSPGLIYHRGKMKERTLRSKI